MVFCAGTTAGAVWMSEPLEFEVPVGGTVSRDIDRRPYLISVTRSSPGHALIKIERDPAQWVPELHDSLDELMRGSAKYVRAI